MLDVEGLSWLDDAACADHELSRFFVEAGHQMRTEDLEICRVHCPVRRQCTELAYDLNMAAGFFGGLSKGQRDRMTKDEALAFIRADSEQARREYDQSGHG